MPDTPLAGTSSVLRWPNAPPDRLTPLLLLSAALADPARTPMAVAPLRAGADDSTALSAAEMVKLACRLSSIALGVALLSLPLPLAASVDSAGKSSFWIVNSVGCDCRDSVDDEDAEPSKPESIVSEPILLNAASG